MRIKQLNWSEERSANKEIYYNHVIAETPLGRFLVTWKGWKDYPDFAIDETPFCDSSGNPIWGGCAVDLEDAKQICWDLYRSKIDECLEEESEFDH